MPAQEPSDGESRSPKSVHQLVDERVDLVELESEIFTRRWLERNQSSDGGFSPDGTFHPLESWDGEAIMTQFRQALLEHLVARHAISEELKVKLLGWRHPGFSTHVGEPIPPNDDRAIEDMASYLVRNPVSLKRLVYIDGQQAVIVLAAPGRNRTPIGSRCTTRRLGALSASTRRLRYNLRYVRDDRTW